METDSFLKNLFLNEELSDVRVIVEKKMETLNFPAHSFVLKQRSPVIAKMLESDFLEGQTRTIVITDFKAVYIEMFLRFLYADTLPETYTGLCKLVKIADKYLVSKLTERCDESLLDFVNVQNVFELCDLADTFSLKKLLDRCMFLIKRAAIKLLKCDDLKCLSKDIMEKIVCADDLNVGEEIEVLWAIWRWGNMKCRYRGVAFSKKDVSELIGDLLKHARWNLTDDDQEKIASLGITVDDADVKKELQPRQRSTIDAQWFFKQCDVLRVDEYRAYVIPELIGCRGMVDFKLMQAVSMSDLPFYVIGVSLLYGSTYDHKPVKLVCTCESSCESASSISEKPLKVETLVSIFEPTDVKSTAKEINYQEITYEFQKPIVVRKNQKIMISIRNLAPPNNPQSCGDTIYSHKGRALFVHAQVYGVKKLFLL